MGFRGHAKTWHRIWLLCQPPRYDQSSSSLRFSTSKLAASSPCLHQNILFKERWTISVFQNDDNCTGRSSIFQNVDHTMYVGGKTECDKMMPPSLLYKPSWSHWTSVSRLLKNDLHSRCARVQAGAKYTNVFSFVFQSSIMNHFMWFFKAFAHYSNGSSFPAYAS